MPAYIPALILALAFVISALLAPVAAPERLTLLLGGLWLLPAARALGRRVGYRFVAGLAAACAAGAGLIGGYYLVTQFPQVASLLPLPAGGDLNANVAAGALVCLLVPALAATVDLWRRSRRALALASGLAVLTGGVALVMADSRGAALAILVAAPIALLPAIRRGRSLSGGTATGWTLALALVLALVFAAAVLFLPQTGRDASLLARSGLAGRVTLWRDMLSLAGDYPLTGVGLGTTMMAHASYVLISHVGFITHAHNLFLQLAVEHGVAAMLAYITLLGVALAGALCSPGDGRPYRTASIVGLVALALHGMVDAGLYASRLAPLSFLPPAFALAVAAASSAARVAAPGSTTSVTRPDWRPAVAALAVALAAAVLVFPVPRARVQANLAAILQTRAELGYYSWPRWPVQDAYRREAEPLLAGAEAGFVRALAINPGDATATRRLGQIELSLGHYTQARILMETSLHYDPQHPGGRLLLGEARAAEGDAAGAAALWSTLPADRGEQIDARIWWHDEIGDQAGGEAMRQARLLAGR